MRPFQLVVRQHESPISLAGPKSDINLVKGPYDLHVRYGPTVSFAVGEKPTLTTGMQTMD
jgi:hypothetical protein